MQTIATLAPIFSLITLVSIIMMFTKLGRVNIYAYFTGGVSFVASFAYFLRGVFKIGPYAADLIYNWTAFLLWLAMGILFFMAGLPTKSSKE